MEEMFLSFVVPVYNAEKYLPQCLDSLLSQDISRESYEILCIDDGSTDHSGEILDAYREKYPLVHVIHQENSGVVSARNAGMAQARGEYIWFADADDLVRENILGKLQSFASGTDWDRIVLSGYAFTDNLSPEERDLAHQEALPCNVPWQDSVVWRNLLRRDFLRTNRLTFRYPELTHGEDGLFMYEVSGAHPKTAALSDTGYFYRVHSGSAETSDTPENHARRLRSYIRIVEILQAYYGCGRKDSETANKLMIFLWFSLYEAASLPRKQAAEALKKLNAMGLFPSRPLPECTMEHAYLIRREGLAGKVLDKLCMNLQTRWGYTAIRGVLKLKALLK